MVALHRRGSSQCEVKEKPKRSKSAFLGHLFLTSLACALSESAPPQNALRKSSRKVALHRRGSSQCEVKEKPKNSGTALA